MRMSDWSSDVCSSDLYTQVRAPISGRIGSSLFTAGALVQAGQPEALATIQRIDPVYVDLSQSAADLLNLRTAMTGGEISSTGPNSARVTLRLPNGAAYPKIGRAHVCTPVTNAQLVCRLLLEKKKKL